MESSVSARANNIIFLEAWFIFQKKKKKCTGTVFFCDPHKGLFFLSPTPKGERLAKTNVIASHRNDRRNSLLFHKRSYFLPPEKLQFQDV